MKSEFFFPQPFIFPEYPIMTGGVQGIWKNVDSTLYIYALIYTIIINPKLPTNLQLLGPK